MLNKKIMKKIIKKREFHKRKKRSISQIIKANTTKILLKVSD